VLRSAQEAAAAELAAAREAAAAELAAVQEGTAAALQLEQEARQADVTALQEQLEQTKVRTRGVRLAALCRAASLHSLTTPSGPALAAAVSPTLYH
jgi:hypothetical protein